MKSIVRRFVKDEAAVTAIEYGLLAALISLAVVTSVTNVGTNLKTKFTAISTALK
jgi:pilus assembly protein Flp/PilA